RHSTTILRNTGPKRRSWSSDHSWFVTMECKCLCAHWVEEAASTNRQDRTCVLAERPPPGGLSQIQLLPFRRYLLTDDRGRRRQSGYGKLCAEALGTMAKECSPFLPAATFSF